jgi:hypothetical protein
MSQRESSRLMLRNLKKIDLPALGAPVVPMEEAERQVALGATRAATGTGAITAASAADSRAASAVDSYQASEIDSRLATELASEPAVKTRLKPRIRTARSALLVRLDPGLHRRLDEVARYNRLTMNDIAVEAIELHLKNFPQPPL